MPTILEKEKTIPVRLECDVLIAGGGTAGMVAALAAARNGARTVIIERYGHLGGTMVNGAGPLHSFFNLYKAFPDAEKKQVVCGIAQEIVDRMVQVGGSFGHLEQEMGYRYDSTATLIDREIFKGVIFDMMEEAGVKVLLHTFVADVIKEGDAIKGLIIESKSGREACLAKVVIDASGDGDVAYKAGVPCINTYPDAHVGMPFGMANVDIRKAVEHLQEKGMITQIVHADKGSTEDNIVRVGFDLKKLEVFRDYMNQFGLWGPLTVSMHENDFSFINCTNIKPLDAIDIEEISRAEMVLRKQVVTMANLLKKNIPGFENAYISWTPIHFGVRRTRIVECEHDITIDEITNATRFDDDVAVYGFHDCAPRIMIKDGGVYGIPYRALLPKGVENLLVAGRLISSNWEAHMSTRNTVSCMAQGQAVGTAAALCAKSGINPRQLDIKLLQKTLKDQGVYLDKE